MKTDLFPKTEFHKDAARDIDIMVGYALTAVAVTLLIAAMVLIFSCTRPKDAYAATIKITVTPKSFCEAVYLVEGGKKAKKPYGVLSVPCSAKPECEQICVNSYHNNLKRFSVQSGYTDFVEFFGSRWAPVGADNDPNGLNRHWVKNVKYFLNR